MTCLGQAFGHRQAVAVISNGLGVRKDILEALDYLGMTWECACDGHTWTYNSWTYSRHNMGTRIIIV